jgi:hypothetical protein
VAAGWESWCPSSEISDPVSKATVALEAASRRILRVTELRQELPRKRPGALPDTDAVMRFGGLPGPDAVRRCISHPAVDYLRCKAAPAQKRPRSGTGAEAPAPERRVMGRPASPRARMTLEPDVPGVVGAFYSR